MPGPCGPVANAIDRLGRFSSRRPGRRSFSTLPGSPAPGHPGGARAVPFLRGEPMTNPYIPSGADLASQLPVRHYFDPDILAQERRLIFDRSARYVGHEKMVPNAGDWRTLAHEGGGRVLLRDRTDVRLLSNVCRHRQALMLGSQTGRDASCAAGNLCSTGGRILCPIHQWSYDARGQLLNAPLFPEKPDL